MSNFNRTIFSVKLYLTVILLFSAFAISAQDNSSVSYNNEDKAKVEVFPNPTSDFLNIDLSQLDLQKPKIEIRSIIGTLIQVKPEKNGDKKYKINVKSFPRGYYLVLVTDDRSKFQQTVRFSKK